LHEITNFKVQILEKKYIVGEIAKYQSLGVNIPFSRNLNYKVKVERLQ
jgi:hypothetical protein